MPEGAAASAAGSCDARTTRASMSTAASLARRRISAASSGCANTSQPIVSGTSIGDAAASASLSPMRMMPWSCPPSSASHRSSDAGSAAVADPVIVPSSPTTNAASLRERSRRLTSALSIVASIAGRHRFAKAEIARQHIGRPAHLLRAEVDDLVEYARIGGEVARGAVFAEARDAVAREQQDRGEDRGRQRGISDRNPQLERAEAKALRAGPEASIIAASARFSGCSIPRRPRARASARRPACARAACQTVS